MRNDHVSRNAGNGAHPNPTEIAEYMARARRMRSEAAHEYLARAAAWIRDALRAARAPKDPVGQCC
jgi:hypothetical protein